MPIDVPTELLSASSGSVGDVVFAHNQHGPYTRARTAPDDPGSALQLAVRAALSECVTAWNATLTATERTAWDVFALAVRTRARIGRSTNAGGLGMYIRANVPRIQAAEVSVPRVDQAPTLFNSAPFTPIPRVVLNVVDDTIHPVFDERDAWVTEAGAAMLFYASAPQPLTRNFWAGPYRYAGPLLGSAPFNTSPGTIPLPQPAALGTRVFVRFRLTRTDARLSHAARLPADTVPQIPPVPTLALFRSLGFPIGEVRITFDSPIARSPLAPGNWLVRFANATWSVILATAVQNDVLLTIQNVGVRIGPDFVRYTPPPFDVKGLFTGLPVATFQFPLI